jgi:hypothetical protein
MQMIYIIILLASLGLYAAFASGYPDETVRHCGEALYYPSDVSVFLSLKMLGLKYYL